MKKLLSLALLVCASLVPRVAQADEGMWLMQQLSTKYDELRQRGLKMSQEQLYDPSGASLKDAVVIFGRGCTGEVISSEGLVLTNHHCGYGSIQSLSSVEHNYLEDGFWAQSLSQEMPVKDLSVTFIDKIEDVTAYVQGALKRKSKPGSMDYLSPEFLEGLASDKVGKLPQGTVVEIVPFYDGNLYLMFTKKVYTDIRFVGAPPSSIGKFGADTDNWAYPRHTGDFSLFRIYADEAGNPAPYSEANRPLKPKRWFNISTSGVEDGKFAMVMGFPGRTYHFFLPKEVQEWKSIDNDIRIEMRQIRQETMLKEMLASPKTNIMYAAKYAYSQNGYKRAQGANWGVEKRNLIESKERQMSDLLRWAQEHKRPQYQKAVEAINGAIDQRASLRRQRIYLQEAFLYGTDLVSAPHLADGYDSGDKLLLQRITRLLPSLEKKFNDFFNKDYDPEVEQKIVRAMLMRYCERIAPAEQPRAIREGIERYGSVDGYVNELFSKSVFSSRQAFEAFARLEAKEQARQLIDDPIFAFASSVRSHYKRLSDEVAKYDDPIRRARRIFVEGLIAQQGIDNLWPDANSTLRFAYGNVGGYEPRDGVRYKGQTTLQGVMEKADSTSWEFAVDPKLQEVYRSKRYGKDNRWAIKDQSGEWKMPVNFALSTHTTGGNSGSPVFDAEGNLIGINFDRNWEGVGGDIQYLADYQRSIICDIRYILMIIEEIGQCPRLLDEMTLVK